MRLILIRHGHYPLLDHALGGRAPHPLSPEGRAQAERLADRLATRPIARVVTSPVRRAQETAAPIAARLGKPLEADPAFTEIDFAAWTDRSFADLAGDPAWQAWNHFRGTSGIPGGETILQVQSRAITGVSRLAALHPAAEVAVITHADIIKAVIGHFLGAPPDLMHRLEIAPASISEIDLYPADAKVLSVNHAP